MIGLTALWSHYTQQAGAVGVFTARCVVVVAAKGLFNIRG